MDKSLQNIIHFSSISNREATAGQLVRKWLSAEKSLLRSCFELADCDILRRGIFYSKTS